MYLYHGVFSSEFPVLNARCQVHRNQKSRQWRLLNQQLLKLEKELGIPFFERRKSGMVPTFAGRIYLNIAHRMMDIKKETYKILQNISNETTGEIAVCYTPEAGAHTIVTMVKRPIAPAFFPQSYVEADAPVVYFTVLSRQRWILSTAFLKGAYLTKPEKCFIALLMDYLHGQLACTM